MRKLTLWLSVLCFWLMNFSAALAAWELPQSGIKLNGTEKQAYIREQMNNFFHPAPGKATEPEFKIPEGWHYEKFDLDGLPVEVIENPNAKTNRVILQLHGGGYVLPLRNGYRNSGVIQTILADAAKTYLVDYSLAPENIFPTAQEEAVRVYEEILRRGTSPENIIVIGDSAGGNLALALCAALKENKIAQPKLLVLISAWTTLETTQPSRKYNANRDLILGKGTPLYDEVAKPTYGRGIDKKNPDLSPLYADLNNFPTMLIQVGGYELFLDENIALAKNAAAKDVKVTLSIYSGMPHDFAMILPELQDSIDSLREIKDFINANMGDK